MTIQIIDTKLIDPNPYQARSEITPESVAALAEDLMVNGLQQRPRARRHPLHADRVQLAFGHRRVAAWTMAYNRPIEIELDEMTDREMFDYMIAETSQREDFSAIDKAKSLQLYIETFGVTQTEAAQRYGLKSQAAVSNLLRLLDLPADLQQQVATGALPERYARSLVSIARLDPAQAKSIAKEVVEEVDDLDKQEALQEGISNALRKKGMALSDLPFSDKWDPQCSADIDGEVLPLPACNGCPLRVKGNYSHYCTRQACLEAKLNAWGEKELKRISKATGIAIAVKGEKLHPLPDDGEYSRIPREKKCAATRHASLRLTSSKASTEQYYNKQITGSAIVRVMTTDPEALRKAAHLKKKPEQRESKQVDYAELRRLHGICAEFVAEAIDRAAPAFVKFWPEHLPLLLWLSESLDAYQYVPESAGNLDAVAASTSKKIMVLKHYLSCKMLAEQVSIQYDEHNPLKAKKQIEDFAQQMKVKLPAGWDEPLSKPVGDTAASSMPVAKSAKKGGKK